MQFAIITSEKDIAGITIKESLLKLFEFRRTNDVFNGYPIYQLKENIKLYTLKKDTVFAENLDKEISADIFIFATRHSSKSKKPSQIVNEPVRN